MFHLDHIYHDESMEVVGLTLHRTRTALVASDHLPLIAELKLLPPREDAGALKAG